MRLIIVLVIISFGASAQEKNKTPKQDSIEYVQKKIKQKAFMDSLKLARKKIVKQPAKPKDQ